LPKKTTIKRAKFAGEEGVELVRGSRYLCRWKDNGSNGFWRSGERVIEMRGNSEIIQEYANKRMSGGKGWKKKLKTSLADRGALHQKWY